MVFCYGNPMKLMHMLTLVVSECHWKYWKVSFLLFEFYWEYREISHVGNSESSIIKE